jgi:hypothetical protein
VSGGELQAVFGYSSPIQALIDQKYLKEAKQVAPDGTQEDVYLLGDAMKEPAAEMDEEYIQLSITAIINRTRDDGAKKQKT